MNILPRESTFDAAFQIIWPANARNFASDLFLESFGSDFPTPERISLAGVEIPPGNWFQCVALYKWPNGQTETVGFCNWIRYENVYLGGGLCVKGNFYKRLSVEHWKVCRARGGVAQLMLEAGSARLNDLPAWFGYCGDKRALIVDRRVGFQDTQYPHLIAKWFGDPPLSQRTYLSAKVAEIGPF